MRQRVLTTMAAMVVAMPAAGTVGVQTASADGPTGIGGATIMPFAQIYRRCDFSANTHTGPTSFAQPIAFMHSTGSEVVADVQIAMAEPNTPYDVRLIEMPRSSATSCNAGDPGVSGGVLLTDPAGSGSVTVRGLIAPKATGAWLYITRPGEFSQTPAEFYTTDFVAPT